MALKTSDYCPAQKYGAEVDAEINFDDAVDTDDIADDAVTTAKINDDAVTNDKVADGAIDTAAKLASNVVETAKIKDQAIDTSKIKNNAVTDSKISLPKISSVQETVTYDQFTDGGSTVGTFDLGITLPAGVVVTRALINGVTGFTGDTSAVITIGDGSTVDRYNTGTPDIFTTAVAIDAGAVSGTPFDVAAVTVTLTVTSAADFTSVNAGELTVTLFFDQATN